MKIRSILLGICMLLTAGCGQVSVIRFVPNINFDPAVARGLPLDQVYVSDDVMRLKGARILVKVEDPRKTIDRSVSKVNPACDEGDWWTKWRDDYELTLASMLNQSGLFAEVQRSQVTVGGGQPDAVLDVAVTEWHEGNKWLRAYLGFGMGATRVQWEGMITNNRTQKTMFAFADARIHPGGPSVMGFPLKVWRGPALIAEDMYFGTKDLLKTLHVVIESPPSADLPAVPVPQESR